MLFTADQPVSPSLRSLHDLWVRKWWSEPSPGCFTAVSLGFVGLGLDSLKSGSLPMPLRLSVGPILKRWAVWSTFLVLSLPLSRLFLRLACSRCLVVLLLPLRQGLSAASGACLPLSHTCDSYLVDPASSHMLVSKIKPCMSQFTLSHGETANGSLNRSRFLRWHDPTWITVAILELIHASKLRPSRKERFY